MKKLVYTPVVKRERMNVHVSRSLKLKLQAEAKARCVPQNLLINSILAAALDTKGTR